MKTKRLRIAFDRALTGLASLTTHGASSSTYLSACVARRAEMDGLEQPHGHAGGQLAARRPAHGRQAASR